MLMVDNKETTIFFLITLTKCSSLLVDIPIKLIGKTTRRTKTKQTTKQKMERDKKETSQFKHLNIGFRRTNMNH